MVTVTSTTLKTVIDKNFLNLDIPYFKRQNLEHAGNLEKYAHSVSWAIGNLLGCSFKEVTPRTFGEVILSIIMFIFGTIIVAKIFSDFANLKHLMDFEVSERK
jgi:hypothetical protein